MKKMVICLFIFGLAGCTLNGGVSAGGGSNGVGVGFGIGTGIRF